jgi:hypothetical protein
MTTGSQAEATRQMNESEDQSPGRGQIYFWTSGSGVSQSNSEDRSHLFTPSKVALAYRNDRTGAIDAESGKANGRVRPRSTMDRCVNLWATTVENWSSNYPRKVATDRRLGVEDWHLDSGSLDPNEAKKKEEESKNFSA